MALTFEQARASVLRETTARLVLPPLETLSVFDAAGRILAEEVAADRDYPPFPRSARDGFAVRAADLPGQLRIIGEVRAGEQFAGSLQPGEAIEIMTGAPLPAGADAVVMVEHTIRDGDCVHIGRPAEPGANFNPKGKEAAAGDIVLHRGHRLSYASLAMLATVGRKQVQVYRKPRVAILPTGDELVDIGATPLPFQIRNSNTCSLAAQVARAGGSPEPLEIARDQYDATRALMEQGLERDLLLLSGGVSAGKYDIVEKVLGDLGAEFFFDRVRIQPGQPLVFGQVRGKFFFGLPGNPGSTMVTFEAFARAALEILSGASSAPLPFLSARLSREFHQKTGLTRFVPARLSADGSQVTPERSHGSGDVAALARANCYLVTEPDREVWAEGEPIRVLLQ